MDLALARRDLRPQLLPQLVDRAVGAFAFEVPEKPAVAGRGALNRRAHTVDRALAWSHQRFRG